MWGSAWFVTGFAAYIGLTWYSLHQASSPFAPCSQEKCFHPLLAPGQSLHLKLLLLVDSSWISIDTCQYTITVPSSSGVLLDDKNCSVPIPPSWRERRPSKDSLRAKFRFELVDGPVVLETPVSLIRMIEHKSRSSKERRNLLSSSALENTTSQALSNVNATTEGWVPYLKYGRSPIRIRFVTEYRPYGELYRQDGIRLLRASQKLYRPIIYVDDNSLQASSQVEISDDATKPPVSLRVKVTSISPIVDSLNRMVVEGLKVADSLLGADEFVDEIRYFLQDEKLYRFACTQLISMVHIWLDYMAFCNEVRFYRGRQSLKGVSASSVISNLVCSIIIFLYLLDGNGTSWVVLLGLASSCSVEGWKVWKLLQPRFTGQWPFVAMRQLATREEQDAASYDRIAIRRLGMILYPTVCIWSLYALRHYVYSSWWSWFIGNLANAVYTFGFISMCPQLYVNYRLKSVAHLPWKVFVYKIFNTFVDDAFAWLVEMPLKHRLMTLRDDVVFMVLLYQAYIYRIDKARTNEYGYSYEQEESEPKAEMSDKKKLE